MNEHTIIVTGGNSGLGYETAKNIAHARQNDTIIIASRNQKKAAAARQKMEAATGNHNIVIRPLDLGSLQSVRDFARDFKNENFPPLYGLVCNAGLNPTNLSYTKEGFETTFGVNYLGHFLLVNLLLSSVEEHGRLCLSPATHTIHRSYFHSRRQASRILNHSRTRLLIATPCYAIQLRSCWT